MPLEPGLTAKARLTVAEGDTARILRTGDVDVLATPRMIALCEEATVKAVAGRLQPGETSVGVRVQIDHLAPTAVGEHVEADAKLERIVGRRLVFSVSVADDRGLVAAGKLTRAVVDREWFLDKAR
ncbi:MAG: thioesterase [Actinomycetota bacterium]|nr:thioesterase [Actinomycetota bacterium]